MVNFCTYIPESDSYTLVLLDWFISFNTSICSTVAFSPLVSCNYVYLVSIDLSSNSKGGVPFSCMAYDYSQADLNSFCDCLRVIQWENIFKLDPSAAANNFISGFMLKLMYISIIVNIMLNLIHLHGFQQLVLLWWLLEISSLICTIRINFLHLIWSSDRLVFFCFFF